MQVLRSRAVTTHFNFLLQIRDVTARDQRFNWLIHVTWLLPAEIVYKSRQFLGLVTCEINTFVKGKTLAEHGLKQAGK